MSAQQAEAFEDEYEEYDEFDDEDDKEPGLSGLVVLLMGVVMLGAIASVVWIAYQHGVRTGAAEGPLAGAPYVTADPEPLKIESQQAQAAAGNRRQVYDRLDGERGDQVEVLAQGPEEPVRRQSADPIADIAAQTAAAAGAEDDEVADRIRQLAAADEAVSNQEIVTQPAIPAQTRPTQTAPAQTGTQTSAQTAPTRPSPAAATAGAGALSGTHLVQVGAVGSDQEAAQIWSRLQARHGDYLAGKSMDVEVADLGARGVFHRVRIGPFSSNDEARTYCEGLKSRGQDCLVRAK